MPTDKKLTSWLFTKCRGVESGTNKYKSIQWQGEGFEPGTSDYKSSALTSNLPNGSFHWRSTAPGNNKLGFTLGAKLASRKDLTQVHLKISSRTLENLASHLMTKYIT